MSTTPDEVDLVVVGGGKAGKSLAMDRARAGWRVVMVERDKIGGTCINVACIPTKALVGSARTLIAARRAAEMGFVIDGEPAVSLDRLRRHKEGVVGDMVSAHERLYAESGMDFVLGTARFVGERTVAIDGADGARRVVRGRDVVVNTGTTPALPDVAGLAGAGAWTSERILRLDRLPASLLIVGGGYIGCEFASMFATFDTAVTLVHGGAPVTAELGLDAAGVDVTERGFVVVDDHLRTTAPHTWAAGDVAGSPQFTHASWHDFRVLRANLTGDDATTAGRLVPYTVFTTPELARVGLTEAEARARGVRVRSPPWASPRSRGRRRCTTPKGSGRRSSTPTPTSSWGLRCWAPTPVRSSPRCRWRCSAASATRTCATP